ncbi:uncharacterized protein KGF55_004437 [Candida pseudojiufengensis]|uniref:uncharacterized protein n=1 Tax=Candida pseudojiufengensis TaxID=497109 RepID=UPI00222468AC|nr:uncharacterized protein KGF55_004437 [Candida pseudojiufengensis]KAI5960544.1 hypothetical protein KGF55_004437 [Candida pseudojiufengensis]
MGLYFKFYGGESKQEKEVMNESKEDTETIDNSKFNEFQKHFENLEITTNKDDNGEINPISKEVLEIWEDDFQQQTKNILTQNIFAQTPIEKVIAKSQHKTHLKDRFLFNTSVETIGSPAFANNQKSSGRCWIFASSNVFRTQVIKNNNLKDDEFQISQSYLYFYDKLEKANFFLENIEDTWEEELDSRLVQFLLRDPVGDGGQWDMIVNLVNKYGLVPHEVFPDNSQSTSSSKLNYIVTEKLREFGLHIRELKQQKASDSVIRQFKISAMKTIYKTLALTIGTPPKPNDEFIWEFTDKDNKYKHFKTNAIDFYKNHVKYDAENHFSIIHDPRNDYNKLYTVERLNNINGGKPIEYVNTPIEEIKEVAIKMLKDNEPIFFGSDVGKYCNTTSGILDITAYDYKTAFDYDLNLSKANRLRTGSSSMTHAMVITAVHIDSTTNKPIRWKIENSWGDQSGKKGWYLMTDEWFSEFVFQIVTNKKYVSKKTFDVWKGKEFTSLPFYDPMGSLA